MRSRSCFAVAAVLAFGAFAHAALPACTSSSDDELPSCDEGRFDAPVFDRAKAGPPCDTDNGCPTGMSCTVYAASGGGEKLCATRGRECAPLTCAAGTECTIAESFPAQAGCSRSTPCRSTTPVGVVTDSGAKKDSGAEKDGSVVE